MLVLSPVRSRHLLVAVRLSMDSAKVAAMYHTMEDAANAEPRCVQGLQLRPASVCLPHVGVYRSGGRHWCRFAVATSGSTAKGRAVQCTELTAFCVPAAWRAVQSLSLCSV